jgi:hypothetical protein
MTIDSFLALAAIVALIIVGLMLLFTTSLTLIHGVGIIALCLAALAVSTRRWLPA